ncbi:MAG TPA: DUF4139 domain-containing protein [Candidatus Acidoferrales bacterium]|nr:DUF4139 domain-containing protein [Candidatus Acidoferrales bacterium]
MLSNAITKRCGLLVGGLLAACLFAAAQQPAPAMVTAQDRRSLAITIYNADFALVNETRRARLPAGAVRLEFEDVPATIEPATVHLRLSRGLQVLDESYEYDVLNPERLLEKYVGKEITLVLRSQQSGAARDEDVKALLLSTNGPVWKIGGEIVTGLAPVGYRFPELPGGLYTRPTLVWTLRDGDAGERSLDVSYLADNLTWAASYVLDLGRDGRPGDLEGWVSLTNNSGATFPDAQLSLVAGAVHRASAPRPGPPPAMPMARSVVVGGVAGQFAEEAAGEYHLYQLDRRITLQNNESKQISLLAAAAVPVAQTYVVEGTPYFYRQPLPQGQPAQEAVKVYLSFRNDAASGLGQPLPAGVIRVYQSDNRGNLQLLGEDNIGHTAKDETARLYIGNAFDIAAERHQTDYRRISDRVRESAFEITLRNHKNEPVTIQVREPVGGSWEVLESNYPAKKIDAFTLGFDVPLGANAAASLTYRVRVTD